MGLFISCSAARLLYISSICLYRNASAAKARRIGRERMGDTVYRVGELALSARERKPAGAPKGIVLALHGGGYGAGYWAFSQIGRASCGERVGRYGYDSVVAGPLQQKNKKSKRTTKYSK